MKAGKPQKQAVAIAYAARRKSKGMSKGGMVENEDLSPMSEPRPADYQDTEAKDACEHCYGTGYSSGGMVDGEEDHEMSLRDFPEHNEGAEDFDNEPMGDLEPSDEFLAGPDGAQLLDNHAEFDAETDHDKLIKHRAKKAVRASSMKRMRGQD